MKTLIFFLIILVVLMAFYILNLEFGWIDFGFREIAIGTAGIAGPFEFFRNRIENASGKKEAEESRFKFRELKRKEFLAREQRIRSKDRYEYEKQENNTGGVFDDPNAVG